MSSGLIIILLIILFLLVIILYVILLFFPDLFSNLQTTKLIIQSGVSSSTDTMITGGNNLYDGSVAIPVGFKLTLSPNNNNTIGKIYYIRNNSTSQPISLVPGDGVNITAANGLNDIINVATLVTLVIKGSTNSFYRIS